MNTKEQERERLLEKLRELRTQRDLARRALIGMRYAHAAVASLDWQIGEIEADLEYLEHGSPF